jgi:hypothetical protein
MKGGSLDLGAVGIAGLAGQGGLDLKFIAPAPNPTIRKAGLDILLIEMPASRPARTSKARQWR